MPSIKSDGINGDQKVNPCSPTEEASALGADQCQFKSDQGYHLSPCGASRETVSVCTVEGQGFAEQPRRSCKRPWVTKCRCDAIGRHASFKTKLLRVRVSSSAPNFPVDAGPAIGHKVRMTHEPTIPRFQQDCWYPNKRNPRA